MVGPAYCQHASSGPAQRRKILLAMLLELGVVAPLLMYAGKMLALLDIDTASAEYSAATRPSPLLGVLQQVLVVPSTEQQKSPVLAAESGGHRITQLASPDTTISTTTDIIMARCPPEVQLLPA